MAVAESSKRIDEAKKLAKSKPSEAETIYKDILSKGPGGNDSAARDYEEALLGLGGIYRDQKKANELSELVRTSRSELSNLPKAKTTKIGMSRALQREGGEQPALRVAKLTQFDCD
jgi:hypothetical protein